MTLIIGLQKPSKIDVGIQKPSKIDVAVGTSGPMNIEVGTVGKQGEPGPEGGTPVVALPYNSWPPVDPQPDTLYLRLAP